MVGRGIQYYEIIRGNQTEKIGFFYDEVVIELLKRAGNKGKTISALRRETGIADSTIRSILKQFIKMKRVQRTTDKSEKNIPNYIFKLRNVSNIIIK